MMHTIRLIILFALVLIAAWAHHDAGIKAEAIWEKAAVTTQADSADARTVEAYF